MGIALSVLATQCSTNSILGAPAFVGFVTGGGLVWLQYELAVPLAMIFTMVFIIPVFQRLRLISVYEYLEHRFDLQTRLLLSGVFQVLRLLAAAITIYGVSAMIDLITGLGLFHSVLGPGARYGFVAGFLVNLALWLGAPDISWLWWNVIGFILALLVGLVFAPAKRERTGGVIWSRESLMAAGFDTRWRLRYATLVGAALIFTLMLSAFGVR